MTPQKGLKMTTSDDREAEARSARIAKTADAIEGAPATNLRPMTLKEIARWREEN